MSDEENELSTDSEWSSPLNTVADARRFIADEDERLGKAIKKRLAVLGGPAYDRFYTTLMFRDSAGDYHQVRRLVAGAAALEGNREAADKLKAAVYPIRVRLGLEDTWKTGSEDRAP